MIPVNVDVPMSRLPIANWVLMGAITCATIAGWCSPHFLYVMIGIERVSQPRAGETDADRIAQQIQESLEDVRGVGWGFHPPVWKLPLIALTSSTQHAGLTHLLGNMLFLWVFGNAVNYKFGQFGYVGLYLSGAVLSGFLAHLSHPGVPALGASGAVMCVMGAFLVFFPRNDVALSLDIGFVPLNMDCPWMISSWIVMLLCICWNILGIWMIRDDVDYIGHVAGFSIGFVIALYVATKGVVLPTRYEQTLLQVFGFQPADLCDE